jgi:peptide/nickel transport system ATP-binding protein
MQHGRIVEELPVERLRMGEAQHQHTRALLAATPRLETGSEAARARPEEETARAPAALAVRELEVCYDASNGPVVDDVSFAVARGCSLGLVGESGSGKSTIARAIVGILSARSGSVQVEGEELTRLRGTRRRAAQRRVQLVPQDPYASLNPRMTVSAAIAEGCDPTLSAAERTREVERLLADVALDPALAVRYPHQLSGGQRQRVAIARALATRPAILIADEITSALDASVQAGVLELLRSLRAELGLTLLFISHDLAVVSQVCDDVAVLHRGRIVELGAIADVFSAPADPYTRALIDSVPRLEAPTAPSLRR